MKTLVAVACVLAVAFAEPPPSNSYLPPSPAGRSSGQGYPQNSPQIVAARNLGGGFGHGQGNGFARSGSHGHGGQARFGGHGDQGYDQNSAAFGRSAFEDAGEPANYNFGYMVNDIHEGTDFGHHEERQEESAHGEYHVVLPDGRRQTVSYEADERGFKPHISYQDSDSLARSGYDSNASNGHGSHARGRSNGY